MLIFACAGLDVFVKQLIKSKLPKLLRVDKVAQFKFKEYVKRGLNKNDKEILNVLAFALIDRNPRRIFLDEYIQSMTGESLQSVDELMRVSEASGLNTKDMTEVDFKDQNVIIDGAHLTGKIDRIVIDGNKAVVHDYKTGKLVNSWDDKDGKSKIYDYKKQLVFYKILIENSRNYRHLKMTQGVIDFIEGKNGKLVSLTLNMDKPEIVELEGRVKKLVVNVYKKIMDLEFPDIAEYSKDLKGVINFEDTLIK